MTITQKTVSICILHHCMTLLNKVYTFCRNTVYEGKNSRKRQQNGKDYCIYITVPCRPGGRFRKGGPNFAGCWLSFHLQSRWSEPSCQNLPIGNKIFLDHKQQYRYRTLPNNFSFKKLFSGFVHFLCRYGTYIYMKPKPCESHSQRQVKKKVASLIYKKQYFVSVYSLDRGVETTDEIPIWQKISPHDKAQTQEIFRSKSLWVRRQPPQFWLSRFPAT